MPVFDRLRLLFAKGTQGVCGGVEEIGEGFQQWSVAGSHARKEDRVRSVASGGAILGPGEPATILGFVGGGKRKRPADEGSRGGIGDGPGLKRLLWLWCLRARCRVFHCAPVSTGGSSGPVERLGGVFDDGSLETDFQLLLLKVEALVALLDFFQEVRAARRRWIARFTRRA